MWCAYNESCLWRRKNVPWLNRSDILWICFKNFTQFILKYCFQTNSTPKVGFNFDFWRFNGGPSTCLYKVIFVRGISFTYTHSVQVFCMILCMCIQLCLWRKKKCAMTQSIRYSLYLPREFNTTHTYNVDTAVKEIPHLK